MSKRDLFIFMHPIQMALIYGTGSETMQWDMPVTVRHATWTGDMKIMNMSCPVPGDGYTIPLTGNTSGFPII
jgi:hypothetical protein